MKFHPYCLLVTLALLVVTSRTAQSATIAWTNTSGGNWSAPANWNPNQTPGATDIAVITSNGSYIVTLDVSVTIGGLTLGGTSGTQTLTNTASTLTLANASVVNPNGDLGLSGGTLTGSGLLTASGTFNWSGGTISGGLLVASNGVLNVSGSVGKYLLAPLTNANGGAINWSGTGNLYVYNSPGSYYGTIYNLAGGLFNVQNDQTLAAAYGSESFNNAGTLRKSAGAGTTTFSVLFNNTGTVEADTGTLSFNNGGNLGGQFTTLGGAVRFTAGEFVFNGPPGFSGDVLLTGGNIHYTVPITNFELSGGTLVGTNLVTGTLTWSAGTINGPLTVASNGVLNVSGSAVKYLYASLTNANGGTINWSGTGTLQFYNSPGSYSGAIYNLAGGLFNVQNDQSLAYAYGYEFFNNAGTLRKSAGAGTTTVSVLFTNTGTVDAQSGTIAFSGGGSLGGTFTTAVGAAINLTGGNFTEVGVPVFSGGGQSQMTGGSLTLTTDLIPGLTMAGGTLYLGATFQGGSITNLTLAGVTLASTNTVTGTMSWSGGTISGGLTVASNGVLNVSGSTVKYLQAALTNASGGTINWSGTGNLYVYNSPGSFYGAIYNLAGGLFNIQNDQSLAYAYGYEFFNNAGTLRKSAGAGTTTVSVLFTNTGTVDAQSGTIAFSGGGSLGGTFTTAVGAAINLTGGNYTEVGVPVFSGGGQSQMTGGSLTLTTDVIPGLTLAGGTLYASAAFQGGSVTNLTLTGVTLASTNTVTGTLNWNAGTISGGLTVASNGVLNVSGSTVKYLQAALTNASGGTINWSGTGSLYVYNSPGSYSGAIYNLAGGLFNVQNDQSLAYAYGYEFFNNAGTLRKSAGAGTTTVSVLFTNTGTVDAQSGTIAFSGGGSLGGTFTTAVGAAINLTGGNFTEVGVPIFSGGGQSQMTGGSLTLTTDVIPGLTMAGGTLYVGAAFQGGSITNLTLAGVTLVSTNTVTGTLNWNAGTISGGLTVASNGLLNISGSTVKYLQAALTNASGGTINWSGTGNLQVYNLPGSYYGAIYNLAGGLFNFQNDQSLAAAYGSEYFNNAGTLRKSAGTGTTTVGVLFNNTGTVEADAGTINLPTTYSGNSLANLAFSLGGTAPGSGYGKIAFSGPLNMVGAFTVSTRNGFRPNPGDTFEVLSYPSATNEFTCYSGLDLGGGLLLVPQFGSTSLSLTTTTYATNNVRPQLFITPSPTGVHVTWPLGFPGWVLQSNTNPASTNWSSVPLPCANQAILPVTAPRQFFRLKQ